MLEEEGYTLRDVHDLFEKRIEKLKEKKYIKYKNSATGFAGIKLKKETWEVGRFVTLIQKSYPIKMFVLQELGKQEIRLGYYVLSLKRLKEKGKLSIVWGQFNPHIPKSDFEKLIAKANKIGIL